MQLIFNCQSIYFYDIFHFKFLTPPSCKLLLPIVFYVAIHGKGMSNRIQEWVTSAFHRSTQAFQKREWKLPCLFCASYQKLIYYPEPQHILQFFPANKFRRESTKSPRDNFKSPEWRKKEGCGCAHRMESFNASCGRWSKFLFLFLLSLGWRVPG